MANAEIPGEEVVFQGKMFEVIHKEALLPDGSTRKYEIARRSPGTRSIIVSPDKKILLTTERRQELKQIDVRLPGGKVFDHLSDYNDFLVSGKDLAEKAKAGAIKEIKEETGLEVKIIRHYHTSICGASVQWDLLYYIVEDFTQLPAQELEDDETIKINWYSLEEAEEICLSGKMQEDRSVGVLLRFLGDLRKQN